MTAIAQIVADELGIDIGQVEVSWGDTELIGEGSRTLTPVDLDVVRTLLVSLRPQLVC